MPIYNFSGIQSVQRIADLNSSTGWLEGCVISINTDDTLFDVSAGRVVIVDSSDPANPTRTEVAVEEMIGVTPEHIATVGTSFLCINSNGELVQSTAFPDSPVVRDCAQIGAIVHGNNVNINSVSQFMSAPVFNLASNMNDLQVAMGVIHKEGNVFSGKSGTLGFDKSAGTSFYLGINAKTDPDNPNVIDNGASSGAAFISNWRDGAGGWNTSIDTALTTGIYDDGTGGASVPSGTLSTNQWVNTRVYFSPDANIAVVQYGQNTYNSSTAAKAAISTEVHETDPEFAGVPLYAVCTHRGGAVDFSLTGDAEFTRANKFGFI